VEALERADGVEVIPAIEVKAQSGVDVMVYFESADEMVDYYRKVVEPKRQGIHTFIPRLREREIVEGAGAYRCLLSAPHPYAPDRMGLAGVVDSGAVRADLLERMDVIETENAMMPPRTNRRAVELATRLKKPMIGGSDAHVPWMVGSALTVIPKDEPFFAALRAGHCRAVGGTSWHLLSPAVFVAGQAKFLGLPDGWTLLKHNLAVFHDRRLRDGSVPEPA
jgi:predicted metal-dependent phosphoesterase TrpH